MVPKGLVTSPWLQPWGVLTESTCEAKRRKGALLFLALVLRLGEFDGNVDHVIPRVVDAYEQEQDRSRGDDEQCRCRIAWEQQRRDEEGSVGGQRKDRMPQPVFQHRLIVPLTARPPEHDDHVYHPPETREA